MDMNEYDKFILEKRCDTVLNDVEQILKEIKDNGLQNEQFLINFLDNLNRLSVLY